MNKRARNRLIGITAIILISIAAIFFAMQSQNVAAYNLTVQEALENPENVGKRIKVGGVVVTGSWDKKTNPMTFEIRDEADEAGTGKIMTVVYSGAAPSTFGDGVTAIVTGELGENSTLQAGEMITKCPSKYESATGAYEVTMLKAKSDAMVGIPVKVAGIVKSGSIVPPGGAVRFIILNAEGASDELNIAYEGALPDGMKDGSEVVITGSLDEAGAFVATDVAMATN